MKARESESERFSLPNVVNFILCCLLYMFRSRQKDSMSILASDLVNLTPKLYTPIWKFPDWVVRPTPADFS